MNTARAKTPLPNVIAFFAAAAGLAAVGFIGYSIVRSSAAQHWPTTTGTVIGSRVVMVDIGTLTGTKGSNWVPRAEVRFGYEVNGKSYESRNLKYRAGQIGATNPDYAPEVATEYPVGAIISVSYDPADPDNAVSDPFPIDHAYSKLIGGVLLLVGAACYLATHRDQA